MVGGTLFLSFWRTFSVCLILCTYTHFLTIFQVHLAWWRWPWWPTLRRHPVRRWGAGEKDGEREQEETGAGSQGWLQQVHRLFDSQLGNSVGEQMKTESHAVQNCCQCFECTEKRVFFLTQSPAVASGLERSLFSSRTEALLASSALLVQVSKASIQSVFLLQYNAPLSCL